MPLADIAAKCGLKTYKYFEDKDDMINFLVAKLLYKR